MTKKLTSDLRALELSKIGCLLERGFGPLSLFLFWLIYVPNLLYCKKKKFCVLRILSIQFDNFISNNVIYKIA